MPKSIDFNFKEFATNMIKTIDGIRSFGRDSSNTPIESRINAFYRALGIPAVLENTENGRPIDNKNNGNAFPTTRLSYDLYRSSLLDRRKTFKVEDAEYKKLL